MLVSGKEKLERMRDGRVVYVGSEKVTDVTTHPAFRHAAQSVADLYDRKADPAKRDVFSYEENGEHFSIYWLRCRNRADLARRTSKSKSVEVVSVIGINHLLVPAVTGEVTEYGTLTDRNISRDVTGAITAWLTKTHAVIK